MIFSTRNVRWFALPLTIVLAPVLVAGLALFTALDCLTTRGLFGSYVRAARGKVT